MNIRATSLALLIIGASWFAVPAQTEHLSSDKIEPGEYRQIHSLVLSGHTAVHMRPGDVRRFIVMSTGPGLREVVAPVEWSVDGPPGINVESAGNVSVERSVKPGTKFAVKAKVFIKESWETEGEHFSVEQAVIVFDPASNPLAGEWTQTHVTACRGGRRRSNGNDGLGSLEFRADGSYEARIVPSAKQVDYWGKYTFDPRTGTLVLTVEGGNGDLLNLRTKGRYVVHGSSLTITGMQMYPGAVPMPKLCRAEFNKTRI